MKKSFINFTLLVIVVFISSCSSTKRLPKSVYIGDLSQEEYVCKIIDNGQKLDALSAKSVFTVNFDKNDPLSISGSIKIKRGKAIMLSVSPLLGIEVARMEITPSGILVLDRMKKRYVKSSFIELNSYLGNNLDYNSLESLFLNSVFLPGIEALSNSHTDKFNISDRTDKVILSVNGARRLDYNFITTPADERLIESDIIVKGTPYKMEWRYSDFRKMKKGEFPSNIYVNVDGIDKKVSLEMELSKLSNDADCQLTTDIPKKYHKVGLDDIFKIFAK